MVLRRSSGAAENAALASGEYRSALFERFTGVLSRIGPEAAVLDLGPTTPSNITFWTQRGHRVSAVGLAARVSNVAAGSTSEKSNTAESSVGTC